MNPRVYLDWNASAPAWPAAVAAATEAMSAGGNASSIHAAGQAARRRIEAARGRVAALVGARPDQVVFTAGATEANNQALRCTGRAAVFVSAVEHPSVLEAAPDAVRLPVDRDGIVDLDALDRRLAAAPGPALVSLMLANNETGVIQPVAEAAAIARRHGALVHCDAVQGPGRIAVDFAALGADLMSLSAHKLGGPQGVGALIVREPALAGRLVHGGGQERGRRAGTENGPGIAGFGAAADAVAALGTGAAAGMAALRDGIERRIRAVAPDAVVFGAGAPRLPNTSQIAMPGMAAETQVIAFDLDGIAVSAGAACSSGRVAAPVVLAAMGVPDALARSAIRISLGWTTTAADTDRFVAAWEALYRRRERRSA
ncbi:MAG: cysteine desulfurase family protein [Rhodospirillales bacterium]